MPETPAPAPKPNAPGGKPKGPGGIPVWGWILGAVAGLFIGIIVYKKSSGSAATSGSTDQSSATSPSGSDSGNSPGGAVASPPGDDFLSQLQALGLGSNGAAGQTTSTQNVPDQGGSTPTPNYSVDTSGATWTPASQPLQTTTPVTSGGYSIPTSSPSAPVVTIPFSTGHGPQLTG